MCGRKGEGAEASEKQLEVWIKFPQGKHKGSSHFAAAAEIQKGKRLGIR